MLADMAFEVIVGGVAVLIEHRQFDAPDAPFWP
jgi:hypothetical protein